MLNLLMNKNKNATPLLIFVVVSLILLLFVPAFEGFENPPQDATAAAAEKTPSEASSETSSEAPSEASSEAPSEASSEASSVESVAGAAPVAETNLAPANPSLANKPSALQGTPAAAPVVTLPPVAASAPAAPPTQITGGAPAQENLPMVPISAAPIIAKTSDGKKVILMIPASIKNA